MKALIIYVPALHKGYIELFEKYSDARIYLLDFELVRNIPRMERDIRAIEPSYIIKGLEGMGFSNAEVLRKNNLDKIKDYDEVIMPEEDISREFIKKHLKHRDVKLVNTFLRWDKDSAKKKNIVVADEEISESEFDRRMMGKALQEAQKSSDWWRQIGAVVVKDGEMLISGFNKPLPFDQIHNILGDPRSNFDYGERYELSKFIHAEAALIANAAKNGIKIDGASIYVTTFPCPSCAKSIVVSGIKEVYYSEGYSLLDAGDIFKSFKIKTIKVNLSDSN